MVTCRTRKYGLKVSDIVRSAKIGCPGCVVLRVIFQSYMGQISESDPLIFSFLFHDPSSNNDGSLIYVRSKYLQRTIPIDIFTAFGKLLYGISTLR